ncbi:hypothetical protein [Azorhizophilus paspali]|uniref:Chitin-binding type-3 domain-containing protein n=1 Tax=Azorhizophilus paspali TaxID=69963 RepID=A0ABV6SFY7_AZOPA
MKIIKPIDITGALLISSSVPENDYAAWSAATAYAVGGRVVRAHRIYEALIANTGVDPATNASNPPKWLDLGATNRWRMFDDRVGSLTERVGSIAVTLQPGAVINSLALFNLRGRSATVVMTDPLEGEVYRREVSLVDAGVGDWYEWFFAPIGRRTDIVLLDLPAYGTAELSVTIDNAADTAACGHLVTGSQSEIGVALYGTGVGIADYSRKEIDEFGQSVVIERAFSKRAEFDVVVDTARVGLVQRLLATNRARPVVWIGEASYEATVLFGFFKDFSISISGPEVSDATITVEGLT